MLLQRSSRSVLPSGCLGVPEESVSEAGARLALARAVAARRGVAITDGEQLPKPAAAQRVTVILDDTPSNKVISSRVKLPGGRVYLNGRGRRQSRQALRLQDSFDIQQVLADRLIVVPGENQAVSR